MFNDGKNTPKQRYATRTIALKKHLSNSDMLRQLDGLRSAESRPMSVHGQRSKHSSGGYVRVQDDNPGGIFESEPTYFRTFCRW